MGANFLYTPTPTYPWKYPSRGGGGVLERKGGAYNPGRGGFKIYTPTPSNEECPVARDGQKGGGGVYIFSPGKKEHPTRRQACRLAITRASWIINCMSGKQMEYCFKSTVSTERTR